MEHINEVEAQRTKLEHNKESCDKSNVQKNVTHEETLNTLNNDSNSDSNDKNIHNRDNTESNQYATSENNINKPGTADQNDHNMAETTRSDIFKLFKAFCKLSVRDSMENLHDENSIEYRSKVLSLELILEILQNPGKTFKSDPLIVNVAIKKHLMAALLQNGVCYVPHIFKISLSIFFLLMQHFKTQLRAEIGLYFSNILLKILVSSNSSDVQKEAIVAFFSRVCKDPEQLLSLFEAYDCVIGEGDVFERMASELAHVAQGTMKGKDKEKPIQCSALECLVSVFSSLISLAEETTLPSSSAQPLFSTTEPLLRPGSVNHVDVEETEGETSLSLEKMKSVKKTKKALEEGNIRFNLKPKQGIEYLCNQGLLKDTPEDIAKFIYENEALDKTVVGDFLGGSKQYNKDILSAYVKQFNFSGKEIDEAIRIFLGMFRLPGEGPVIDRFMENFGLKYYEDNPHGRLNDPDAVYKIAFAIIMLATDLHNPNVKNKLTLDDWYNMINKQLAMDLPENYLHELFNRVQARPIELSNQAQTASSLSVLNPKERQQLYIKETNQWIDTSLAQLNGTRHRRKQTEGSINLTCPETRKEMSKAMFELVWGVAVVSLSVLLEGTEDMHCVELCLIGFSRGIHLACTFAAEDKQYTVCRSAFVTALAKLANINNSKEIKEKHIMAINTLFSVAEEDGNQLGDDWTLIFTCISMLQRINILSQHDDKLFPDPSLGEYASQNARALKGLADTQRVSRLFMGSSGLTDIALLDYVRALASVATEEEARNAPRLALAALAEVALYNVWRMRLVWAELWELLGSLFAAAGSGKDRTESERAIDELRQIAEAFLKRDEARRYSFQYDVLLPFEKIAENKNSREDAVELVSKIISLLKILLLQLFVLIRLDFT